jgi:hypothetical protein
MPLLDPVAIAREACGAYWDDLSKPTTAHAYRSGERDGSISPQLGSAERAARLALELAAQVADSRSKPGIAAAIRGGG